MHWLEDLAAARLDLFKDVIDVLHVDVQAGSVRGGTARGDERTDESRGRVAEGTRVLSRGPRVCVTRSPSGGLNVQPKTAS